MFVSIINDCRDVNASIRQTSRFAGLFAASPNFCGVESDLEAAGNLIDVLDATQGSEGIIAVNVAPRHGEGKSWKNGSPFCYFWVDKRLVISTIQGYTLSLVKKLNIVHEIRIVDIYQILEWLENEGCDTTFITRLQHTQFRSFDYVPFLAQWVWNKKNVPSEIYPVDHIIDVPDCVWWIDNFGNAKTTICVDSLKKEIKYSSQWEDIPFFPCLKDVPDGNIACIVGSSGYKHVRFLEIVAQGGSAVTSLNLHVSDAPIHTR